MIIQDNLSPQEHIDKMFGDIHDAKEHTDDFSLPR